MHNPLLFALQQIPERLVHVVAGGFRVAQPSDKPVRGIEVFVGGK
jgi:hypothetical protein